MERMVFSGSLTGEMHDLLLKQKHFHPLDILISQLDRSAITKTIEWKKEGFCRWLFIDSGAFSVHTGKAKCDVDEYISYLNSIDDYYDVAAQLDTIPGTLGKPKSKKDYEESARKSWENFLYMRSKLKSPDKLMPVFHYGEDVSALKNMLEWKDEEGHQLTYIGLSPANDVSQAEKDIYLKEMYGIIKASSNPNVKTHLYGMTSLSSLAKFPCYSADSISHRLRAGYNKIFTRKWGTISLSDKARTSKTKSNMSFIETCDEETRKEFEALAAEYGFTVDELKESSAKRTVMDMIEVIRGLDNEYKYKESNLKARRKWF